MKTLLHLLLSLLCLLSAASAATTAVSSITSFTTPPDPSLCPSNASAACVRTFENYYSPRANATQGSVKDGVLEGALRCNAPLDDKCTVLIAGENCSALVDGLYANYTAFALRCSEAGLQWVAWKPDLCPAHVVQSLNDSTSAFCSTTINNTLHCHPINSTPIVTTIDRASLFKPLFQSSGCTTLAPTTSTIPLAKNPVGPEAITAIVVLVTAFIICILAGFFFWPKCHMNAEDQDKLVKKQHEKEKSRERMKKEGETNAGFSESGAVGGGGGVGGAGAKYDAKQGSVAVNMAGTTSRTQPGFGPSAA